MSWFRRLYVLGLALLLSVGVSCTSTDSPTEVSVPASAEQSPPSFDVIGGLAGDLTTSVVGTLGKATDLLTCSPQPYAATTRTIGPKGGKIDVGTHRLDIPKGALSGDVEITAEQVPGSTNSVRFSPEGLHFDKKAQLTMTYDNCVVVLLPKKIAYTDENLKILEVLRSLDLFKKEAVSAPIDHFSRYAITW
jgi:hypothetical protein